MPPALPQLYVTALAVVLAFSSKTKRPTKAPSYVYASLICEMYPPVDVGTTTVLVAVEHAMDPPCCKPTSCPVVWSTKHVRSVAIGLAATDETYDTRPDCPFRSDVVSDL